MFVEIHLKYEINFDNIDLHTLRKTLRDLEFRVEKGVQISDISFVQMLANLTAQML